jgi:type VI protein secretion system component Hcp
VKGAKQGQITQSTSKGHENQTRIGGFTVGVSQSAGGAQGKRLMVKRTIDGASPLLLQALVTDEALTEVRVDVCEQAPTGALTCAVRVDLTPGRLSSMSLGATQEFLAFDYNRMTTTTGSGAGAELSELTTSAVGSSSLPGGFESGTIETAPSTGADFVYLSIPGVRGNVTSKGREQQIEVRGAAFKVVKAPGADPQFSTFDVDTADPHASFLNFVAMQTAVPDLHVEFCNAAASGALQCLYDYWLRGARFQSYVLRSGGESIGMSFRTMEMNFNGTPFQYTLPP